VGSESRAATASRIRGETQPQYISDLAHRQSLGRHLVPFDKESNGYLRLRTVSGCRALRHRVGLITITALIPSDRNP
jgi:hypothetical protein